MTNLRSLLQRRLPKAETQELALRFGNDPASFEEIWSLTIAQDKVISPRAAWIMDHLLLEHPALLKPHLEAAVSELGRGVHHDGVLRILSKALSQQEIPEVLHGELFGICRDHLLSPDSAIAIKVHGMEIATKIGLPFPDLREELIVILERMMGGDSAAIRSRGRKMLRKLRAGAEE